MLVPLLRGNDTETVTAAVAALRNLSIHNGNEVRTTTCSSSCFSSVYMARMTYLLIQQTANLFVCALGHKHFQDKLQLGLFS